MSIRPPSGTPSGGAPAAHATTHKSGGSDSIKLNEFAAPTAAVALNAQKITGLANGTAPTDAAAFGQIPAAAPPILGPTGAIRETYGRQFWDGNAQLLASGSLYLAAIPLVQGDVVSNITFYNAVSMTGQSHWWFALFNSSFQMLAVTADQLTTGWTSGTSKATLPIAAVAAGAASSFAATYTGAHYVGVMVTASGTKPNVQGKIVANGVVTQDTPILGGLSTGSLTAPPAFPFTAAAPALSGFVLPYAYVS